ncbi:MAG: hypothetical protein IJH91_03890 [Mogibacterium sp.]|nr:hypothetical protein [Mogibacterium sp.]
MASNNPSTKSEHQIWVDLNKAKQQAAELERAAQTIRTESAKFGEYRNEVAHAWTSDSSTAFTSKMGMVTEDLLKIARELDNAAAAIRQSAQRIYNAEMEAKRLAEQRKV